MEPSFDRVKLRKFFGVCLAAVEDRAGLEPNAFALQRVAQLGGGGREILVLFEIMNETECCKVSGVVAVNVRRDGQVISGPE